MNTVLVSDIRTLVKVVTELKNEAKGNKMDLKNEIEQTRNEAKENKMELINHSGT